MKNKWLARGLGGLAAVVVSGVMFLAVAHAGVLSAGPAPAAGAAGMLACDPSHPYYCGIDANNYYHCCYESNPLCCAKGTQGCCPANKPYVCPSQRKCYDADEVSQKCDAYFLKCG